MNLLRRFQSRTFSALAIPSYRRYYAGQSISLVGTWMQTIAQGWLLLTLTGSGTALGLLVAVQMTPILLLGPYGGVIADRVDKRRLMMLVQGCMGSLALVLGILSASGRVQVWHVFVLAGLLGCCSVFDQPTRQAFVLEMVGPDDLRNAVSLNSVLVNAARAVGPAMAGILIATVGVSVCFLVNAVSYIAVIASLATLDRAQLRTPAPSPRKPGQLREGLRYVRSTRGLAIPLSMMALIGTLVFLGTTPLGGPVAGFVAERAGGRAGLLLGGVACLVAAGAGAAALRRANLLAATA